MSSESETTSAGRAAALTIWTAATLSYCSWSLAFASAYSEIIVIVVVVVVVVEDCLLS